VPVVLLLQVTEDDVRSAYRLWFDALSGSAADEEGQLDMNLLSGEALCWQQ
jgi:DNA replicative helicase MCM subunit Mcm2 (Cdc46/Mcm family)